MNTGSPQVSITRLVNAPRKAVYQAFANPDHFSLWWGPFENVLPREEISFDLRSGGYMQWREFFPAEPEVWTIGRIDLTEVVEEELLDGAMQIAGNLPGGFEPFEKRMRIEFYDQGDHATRLEIFQWLPESYVAATEGGWGESLTKLDATLIG